MKFLKSIHNVNQLLLEDEIGVEVAFIGKSNAGKSSALNKITSNIKLARTSKTPGRTQSINLFQIKKNCRLADLPGYYQKKQRIL